MGELLTSDLVRGLESSIAYKMTPSHGSISHFRQSMSDRLAVSSAMSHLRAQTATPSVQASGTVQLTRSELSISGSAQPSGRNEATDLA